MYCIFTTTMVTRTRLKVMLQHSTLTVLLKSTTILEYLQS